MTERFTNLVFFSIKEEAASLFKSRVMPVIKQKKNSNVFQFAFSGAKMGNGAKC